MVEKIVLREVDGEVGIEFPPDIVEEFGLKEGDLMSIEEVDGGLSLRRIEPDIERAREIYERGAEKYQNALRELADS